MVNRLNSISLFSGLGGDSLGIEYAGGNVIAYNEYDSNAIESHELNFPNSKLIIDESKNEKEGRNILNIPDSKFEVYKNNVDLVFAGFPCQSFSSAGKRKEDDPRNTMFREFVRVVSIIKPKYLIGENVKGLLTKKTNNGELYFDIIKSEFERVGYNIYDKVCKVNLFRVPQNRERLIIVGIRNDLQQEFTFPSPVNDEQNLIGIINFNMEGAIKIEPEDFDMTQIPNECILKNMENDETENNVHPYLKLKAKNDQRTRHTYNGKTYDSLLSFGKRDSPIHAEIIDIRKPSKTIICAYDHQPRLFVPLQNKNGYYLRTMLPDELKQIQGFPSNFQIVGNRKEKIKQIGNAVPPPLIEAIVRSLLV
tara:strand:+ start:5411 stop:6505 length:1095 start_codon:yes stop_codon:yes gene_type:complete